MALRPLPSFLATSGLTLFSAVAAAGGERPVATGRARLPIDQALVGESVELDESVTVSFREERGQISILELAGNYDRLLESEPNVAARAAVAQAFLAAHDDAYDFLVVFTQFPFDTAGASGFHWVVRNEVTGIGLDPFDQSDLFGSQGVLRGYTDMARLADYETDPLAAGFEESLSALLHELSHQWGARVAFRDGNSDSDALLGLDGSHWSYLLDSEASVHFGADWRDNGDGSFTALAVERFLSPLDLYLAGFYSADEVPPFTLLEAPGIDPDQPPQVGATIVATPRTVTVDEVIAAEGPRGPPAEEAPHDFQAAFLYLVAPNAPVSDAELVALENLRRELLTRFTAATGGRGILAIHSSASSGGGGTPGGGGGGEPRPGPASVLDALAWLRGRQQPDGFWEDLPSTRVRDTALVATVLDELDPEFTGEARDAARTWLEQAASANRDALSRQVRALYRLGADAVGQEAQLLAARATDGGWGLGSGLGSDVLDTALALLALASGGDPPAEVLTAAADLLLAQQGADGGWSPAPGGASRIRSTAAAVLALQAVGHEASAAPAATAWLAGRQNPDGGFGDSPSTPHETAEALETLMDLGALEVLAGRAADAAAYLGSTQTVEGSWGGSVFATALVARALQRFSYPNWYFAGAPTVEPPTPFDGEHATVSIAVANNGNLATPPGLLRLFDDPPEEGGLLIVELALGSLEPGASLGLEATWDTTGRAGERRLVALVDPDATTAELSELDNRAEREVEVVAAPVEPELAIYDDELVVDPPAPDRLPTQLAVSVPLRNLGQSAAPEVRVSLAMGEPDAEVASVIVAVPGRSSTAIHFLVELSEAGATTLTVTADADGAYLESDETNNVVSRTIETTPSFDLEVLPSDLMLLEPVVYLGLDATFEVRMRNRGTSDAPDTDLALSVSDGTTARTLPAAPIQLDAGEESLRTVVWRVDLVGELAFSVVLDPVDLLPEVDETNNAASLPFTASVLDVANLTVSHQDLGFIPEPALEGSPLQLSALVRNTGGIAVENVVVGFYDGDPDQGGTPIGEPVVLPELPAGGAETVLLLWTELPDDGERLLFVLVDPADAVAEYSEEDNAAFRTLEVLSLPDAALGGGSLTLEPPLPAPGQTVTLAADVANLGEQPLSQLRIRAWEGDPAAGGVPVGGDQSIDLLPGGGTDRVLFTWTLGAEPGTTLLVVTADPDGEAHEGDETNNTAARSFGVQDEDFFVTAPYFSPDGDEIADTTTLFFALEQAATIRVEVVDVVRDLLIRTFTGPDFEEVASGEVTWDGRDELGALARDAEYALRVVDSNGETLGEARAALDTDRSSLLLAVDTPYEQVTNLSCDLDYPDDVQAPADEEWAYFYVYDSTHPVYPKGIFRRRLVGGELETLVSASWLGNRKVVQLVVDPSGRKMVLNIASFPRQIWVGNTDGTGLVALPLDFNPVEPGEELGEVDILGFGADGDTLIIATLYGFIAEFPLSGAPPQYWWPHYSFLAPFAFSPDRRRLAVRDTAEGVALIDLEAGSSQIVLPVANYNDRVHFAWSLDGRELAVASYVDGSLLFFDRDGALLREMPLPTVDNGYMFTRPHWRNTGQEVVVTGYQYCTSLELADVLDQSTRSLDLEGTCDPWPPGGGAMPEAGRSEEGDAPPGTDGPEHDGGEGLRHPVGHLIWDPNDRALLWFEWDTGFPLTAIFLDEDERQEPFFEEYAATFPRFTASGRTLLFDSKYDSQDPENGCWGSLDRYAFHSLMNLTVDLEATRPPGSGGFLLEGTAMDLNFDRWWLDYAPAVTPDAWSPIAPPVETTVVDGYLGTWVPPGPGTYHVRLTAEDLAGNTADRVRTVVSSDSPEITDVTVTPRLFSPNGDGVLDELAIQYRVLAPVNLEIHFFDPGDHLVSTYELSHSTIGELVTVSWDGRDELGRVVGDGEGRVLVHQYEFFFEIDATPPVVEEPWTALQLVEAEEDLPLDLRLSVASAATDPNITHTSQVTLERGEGALPGTWLPMDDPDVLKLEQFVGWSFRTTAVDDAGNLTVHHSELAPEGARLTGLGHHEIDPETGQVSPISYESPTFDPESPCIEEPDPCFIVQFQTLRLALAEAARADLAQVWLEHRVRPSGEWQIEPITEFYDPATQSFGPSIPPSRFEFVWDPTALDPDGWYDLRVRVRDANGGELLTQEVALDFAGEGLALLGRADWFVAQSRPEVAALLAQAGLDPVADLVLWGTERIEAPLAELTLFLASDEDPRYDPPLTFAPAAQTEGFFIFHVEEWQSCTDYFGHLVALTEPLPGTPPQTSVTAPTLVHLPCLELTYDVTPATTGGCGEAIEQTARTITLSPRSLDGSPLLLLSLFGPGEDGEQELLYTENQPENGETYPYTLDLQSLPEGVFSLAAILSNVNGEEVPGVPLSPSANVAETDAVAVDRTAPELDITYPVEGQRLCADPLDGGLLVEGTLEDDWGAAYLLEFGVGAQPEVWLPVGDQEGNGTLAERLSIDTEGLWGPPGGVYDGRSQQPATTVWAGPLHRLGGGYEEELTVRAHAADASGAHVCREVTVFLDARVAGPSSTIDIPAFSPNGDGLLEVTTLTVQAAEATTVGVEIFPGVLTELGPSITGPKVRSLAADLPVVASASLPWDGRSDDGEIVADDSYLLFVTWLDACGNAANEVRLVHVDTTPPAVEIVSPTPETPLPMIVDVVGLASDWHFQFWSLEVGEGADPASWIELEGSTQERSDPAHLAYWNTFGLAGTYTLRLTASDTVGLSAEARVVLELDDRTYLITYLEPDPELFSPNGDGRRETTAIRFGLQFDVRLTLTVHDPQGSEVARLVDDAIRAPGAWIESWDGGAVADDRYTVRLEAALLADPNVTQTEEIAVDLDRTAPLVALARPTPGGWLRSTDDVFGTISDQRLATWSLSIAEDPEVPVWQEIAAGDTNRIDFSFARLTGFAEGDYALRALATDEAEIETEVVLAFGIDDTPPALALTAPPAGSHLGAILGPIEILGSVEEDHLALWRLEVGAGAEPTTWMLLLESDESPAGPTLFTWEVSGAPEGEVALRLEAHDLAGNGTTVTLPLVVDNAPPLAAITSPSPGAYVTGPAPVLGTADDAHLVEYELAAAPAGTQAFAEVALGTSSVVDGTLATWNALPPDGPYDLRLAVRDQVGHETQALVSVHVDTQPPAPPTGLAVVPVEDDGASLTWDANGEPDLAGYHVFRNGARLTVASIPDPSYVDPDLGEGLYLYTVTAVDDAGHESGPSAPALLRIDHTPPLASIFVPLPEERVAGVVEVRGTAWSADDFAEYRLWAIDQATGGSSLLAQATAPVQAGPLGSWSTLGLPEGAPFRLRLEAEDLTGNLASHEVAVTVDNLPPAPPTGLAASVAGSNVHLTWNANSEPDLAAYLLFRDDEPRGGELTVLVYDDLGVADGTYVYTVHALDTAGNLSGPSNPKTVTIDTRAPHATIVEPTPGTAFDGPLYVLATSADEDIAQVLFQFRPAGTGAWLDVAAPAVAPPWDSVFDPGSFEPPLAEGAYDLQAVATDTGGRIDPAPTPITVVYTDVTPPEPPTNLVAQVHGGEVTLTWSPVSDADLGGYLLYRSDGSGQEVQVTAAPIEETLYLDTDLADDLYTYRVTAVDTHGNESTSASAEAHVYTPWLRQPMTPRRELATELEGSGEPDAAVAGELVNADGTVALPPATTDGAGAFRFDELPLVPGDNQIRLWVVDDAGNTSKEAEVTVVVGSASGPPTGLAATAEGTLVDLAWNPNPEPDVVGYRPFRDGEALLAPIEITPLTATASDDPEFAGYAVDGDPTTAWWPDLWEGSPQWIEVSWSAARIVSLIEVEWWSDAGSSYPAEDFDIEAWSGYAWVALFEIRGNEAASHSLGLSQPYRTERLRLLLHSAPPFDEPGLAELRVVEQPLVPTVTHSEVVADGVYRYHVTAVNAYAFESDPSAEVEIAVGDLDPPAPVVLSGMALGFDVELTWTASASPDVLRYDLYRDGAKFAEHFDLTELQTLDRALPSATYAYLVRAVDGAGNESPDSNVVWVTVAMPATFPLAVATVPEGRALDLSWEPDIEPAADHFTLWRAGVAGGPYTSIGETAETSHRDEPLTDGTSYFYVVVALDAAGGAVASSNEANGTPADTVAPAPPELHHPTVPGLDLAVRDGSITLVASTEPGATAEFFRDGAATASVQAAHAATVATGDRPDLGARRLSPDGALLWGLAYADDGSETWLFHHLATGEDEVVLEAADGARWTADSRRLVFATDEGAIRAYDIGRRQFEDLALTEEVDAVAPSPGVDRLAVIGTHDAQSGVWIVDLANGQWTLRSSLSPWNPLLEWSPTGERVAYRRSNSLYLLDVATGSSILLSGSLGTGAPSWSPDGQALLYPVRVGSVDQVWRHRVELGTSEQVTFDPAGASRPQWSADGRRFAFLSGSQQVFAQDWLTGATEVLYESATSCSPCTLQWVAGGPLWIAANGAEWALWSPAGLATALATPLLPGLNTFTATARDGAGNASGPSSPISIEWASAGAPDLAITAADLAIVPAAPAPGGVAAATVTVRNLGPTTSSPTDLLGYVQGPSGFLVTLFEAAPLPALPPGAATAVSGSFATGAVPGAYELVAAADPFHRVEESDEANNVASRAFPVVPEGGVHLATTTDRPVYLPEDAVEVAVEIGYGGEALPVRLEVRIEDAAGISVATVLDEEVVLEYGDLRDWQVAWSTAGTFAGSYRAAADLFDHQGAELAAAVAPFVVSEGFELAAAVATDRASYQAGESVRVTGEVHYVDGNTLLTDLEGRFELFDPAGVAVGNGSFPLGPLLPGGEAALSFDWSSAGREPGTYRARWEVLRGGLSQVAAETLFELAASPGGFSGELTLDSHEPPFGLPLVATLRVTNESSEAVGDATVRLRLVDPETGTTLEEREWPVELVPGGVFEEASSFETDPLDSIEYLLILAVETPAGGGPPEEQVLAVETFAPVDRTAPLVEVSQPLPGAFLGAGDPVAVALAHDERSGIAAVEARLDAGEWGAMTPLDPAAGDYELDLSHLAEGPHQLEARATDGAANVATVGPIAFTVDWTPPSIEVTGVEDGGAYETAVTPVIAIVESHPAGETIRLDGEPFVSGTSVEAPGGHLLEVEAEDLAGNTAALALGFTIVPPGQTLDLVVNTVNDVDDGACDLDHCSLREAIATANRHPSFDTIRFAIPGLGTERVILPRLALPAVTQPVWIDGASQPGSTCVDPEPQPAIVLDGSQAGPADGLTLATWGVTVSGITVRRFALHGLRLAGGGNHSIACNRLGDDGSGDPTAGNGGDGLHVEQGSSGNAIGAAADSGVCAAPCNVIAFNGGAGIALAENAGTGNALRRNHIHRNEGLGIDLGADGLTPNDPGDVDAGANGLQNFPQIAAVRPGPVSEVDVVVQGAADGALVVDLFSVVVGNAGRDGEADSPPFGEGDSLLASAPVTTDALGLGSVTLEVAVDLSTTAVTATATEEATGNTSEFSPVFAAHLTHALVDELGAEVTSSGEGFVAWTTASEAGTLGFDLYREVAGASETGWRLVNGPPIATLLETPAGAAYRLAVDGLSPGDQERFVLVEVESGGARRLHGPYGVTVTLVSEAGEGSHDRRRFRRTNHPVPVRWPRWRRGAGDGATPAASSLKIGVRETGGVRLPAAEIASALATDEETVRLRIQSGQVRIRRRGEGVPWLGAEDGGSLTFYGLAAEDSYSPESVYWLTLEAGPRMAAIDGGAPPPQPGGWFPARRVFEENLLAATVVALDPDEDFWFWRGLSAGDPVYGHAVFPFDLVGLERRGSGASVAVTLYGASSLGLEGEHVIEVLLGGVSLGTTSWTGIGWHQAAFAVPRGLLVPRANQLELIAQPAPGVPYSFAYVDRFELTYPRRFEAEESRLPLSNEARPILTVDGLADPDIVVLETTDPSWPRQVTNLTVDQGAAHRVSFRPRAGERDYWVAAAGALTSPAWTLPDSPSDLHSPDHAADLLVVSTPELLQAFAPLLDHRRSQGWRVIEADIEDVYDEFNDGFASPHALRAFVAHAAANWAAPPRWVLLAGAGTYDYRDHLGLGGSFVPPILVRTPQGLFAADGLYGDFAGEDGVPDLAVGRIPAKTAAEAAAYAAKVVAYETQSETAWRSTALLLADDRDGAADFGLDTLELAEELPPEGSTASLLLDELDLGDLRSALFGGLAAGTGLLHYLGHGGVDRLAGEPILSSTDVPDLANAPRLPVLLAPTCVAARHEIPDFRSLGERLVVEEDGGAVAVLSSSGLSQHGGAVPLARELLAEAWARFGGESLGEALLAAYQSHLAAGGSLESLRTLTLLGDPSLRPPE